MSYDYQAINIEVADGLAMMTLMWPDGSPERYHPLRVELPDVLRQLRDDDDVRVVVMEGAGGRFLSRADTNADPLTTPKFGMMTDRARTYEGIRNNGETLETMVSMEKPIIAKVNGDAVGIGATLVFFCDLVIANEDAYITDSHIALHHLSPHLARGIGVVPGDGGAIGWPLQMSLFKAKEYLMLGRPVKARELADIHVINWAVPAAELDARVAEIVGELLEHPAWALAWSKLVLNKHVKDRLNLVHDLSFSLEAHSMRISELEDGKGLRKL